MAVPGSTPLLAEDAPCPSSDGSFTSSELRPLLTEDVYFLPATTYGEDHCLLNSWSGSSPTLSPSSTLVSFRDSPPPALPDSPPPRPEHSEGYAYRTVLPVLEPSQQSPSSDYGSSPKDQEDKVAGVLEMRDHLAKLFIALAEGLGDDVDMLEDVVRGVITEHLERASSELVPLAVFVQDVIQTLLRKDYAPDVDWLSQGLWPLPHHPYVRKHRVREVLQSECLCASFLAFLTAEHDEAISWYRTVDERSFK